MTIDNAQAELRGKYPISTFRGTTQDELVEFITAHTTKLLNEQLDRLENRAVYGHLAIPDNTQFTPLTAIENERKKLNGTIHN